MSTTTSKAAAVLGRKGGKAGRGASQRRSPEHYRAAAQESATVRRALKAIRAYIRGLEPGTGYLAAPGDYDAAGAKIGDQAWEGEAAYDVRLVRAAGGGLLLGVYEWARIERDSDTMRYRPL